MIRIYRPLCLGLCVAQSLSIYQPIRTLEFNSRLFKFTILGIVYGKGGGSWLRRHASVRFRVCALLCCPLLFPDIVVLLAFRRSPWELLRKTLGYEGSCTRQGTIGVMGPGPRDPGVLTPRSMTRSPLGTF